MIEFKRRHALLIVILAALAVYANSLWNGFAYDDIWIIEKNTRVHQLRDLGRIWLTPYWPSFGSQLGLYRPFAIFAFAVEWAISDGAPWFFHLVNVLLHAGVSVLVYLFIEKLFTARAALAGAVMFAVHPLHTEAVANVVGQNELWAALGVIGACLMYVSRPPGVGISVRRGAAIILCFAISLLAKESAVVLPGLLVLLDFVQGRVQLNSAGLRRYVRALVPFAAGFAVALIAYLALRHSVLGTLSGTDNAPGLPHLKEHHTLNGFRAWPEFLRLLFFPLDLSVDYAPAVVMAVESITPMVILGMVMVAAVTLITLATPKTPRAGLVAGWFLITILPVANFFFPIGVLIAERTLYTPSLAVCFVGGFAWEAVHGISRADFRRLAHAAAAAIVVFFGARTVIRNPDWDSLTTVWRSLHRDHPESYRAQWLNAISMWNQGRPDLAERYFEISYKLWPRDSQMLSEWANFYIGQKRFDKAIGLLERSRDMTPFVGRTYAFLAYAYLHGGRPKDALETARHAMRMEGPDSAIILPVIAGAHERLGNFEEAARAWELTVGLKSGGMWLNWAMLARAQASAGRTEEALRSADVALSKTSAGSRSRAAVEGLKAAISGACYPVRESARSCDTLAGWEVAVGTAAQ